MAFWQVSLLAIVSLIAAQAYQSHPECPPLWTRYKESCYRYFGKVKTWQAAEEHCNQFFTQSGQGHLASIHSSDENNLLKTMWETSVSATEGHVWLGATDEEVETKFVWTDGTGFNYEDWLPGQPDNIDWIDRPEHCLCLWDIDSIGWNDLFCDSEYPYICKMPASL